MNTYSIIFYKINLHDLEKKEIIIFLPQGLGAQGCNGISQYGPVTSFGHKHRPYLLSINAHFPPLLWHFFLHAVGVMYSQ